MTQYTEVIDKMKKAKSEYEFASARGSGMVAAKERMKNIAFNYFDKLLDALIQNDSLQEEIDALDRALADADNELKELKTRPKNKKKSNTDTE